MISTLMSILGDLNDLAEEELAGATAATEVEMAKALGKTEAYRKAMACVNERICNFIEERERIENNLTRKLIKTTEQQA